MEDNQFKLVNLHCARGSNSNSLLRRSAFWTVTLNRPYYILAFNYLPKYNVSPIQLKDMSIRRGKEWGIIWRTHGVLAVVMKNWEPLVFLPALAIERRNGSECFTSKFSSRKKKKVLDVKCNNKKGRFAYTGEFRTVNGLSTGTVAVREIPTLDHELFFFWTKMSG